MKDIWLNTTYACGLVTIDKNKVIIETCPIYKWMKNKEFSYVLNYLKYKKQLIKYVIMEDLNE